MKLLPCLLAGGTGTRLWPLSRESYPKQFLRLMGPMSLLQKTAARASSLESALSPLVICADQHRFIVAEQLREANIAASILLEPVGRNTGPAAACAALWARREHGPETLVFLMAADHVVPELTAFGAAVRRAAEAAMSGYIVTFGVTPTRPEPGFGYVRAGEPLEDPLEDGDASATYLGNRLAARSIEEFVEKPRAEVAQKFLESGNYFWNGGMFLFRADVFLDEFEQFEPESAKLCRSSLEKSANDLDFIRLDSETFGGARDVSIDYAIMERTQRAAMVPLDAGWDDVGAWDFLDRLPRTDNHGNVTRGDVVLENVHDSQIHAEHRLVAAVGISDHIVVETADAVLVTTRAHVQEVRKVVLQLKAEGRREVIEHARVYRPWGWYETLARSERFQVKHILVKPEQRLSLQMHHHRAEHWVVVRGTARVTCEEKTFLVAEDQSTYIPLGCKHRLENPGRVPLELIEVQSGAYLGEDDILRFDDIYGRASKPTGSG